MRYELVFPTTAFSSSNEEWNCCHSTSVVDIRSGVTGSLSKNVVRPVLSAIIKPNDENAVKAVTKIALTNKNLRLPILKG